MSPRTSVLVATMLFAAACSGTPSVPAPSAPADSTGPGNAAPTVRAASVPEGDDVTATRIFDGDSFEADTDGEQVEVRLRAINAPERDECYGDEARDGLISLAAGGPLTLVPAGLGDTDRFGRLLRFAYRGDLDVNATLVARGLALSLGGDSPFAGLADGAWDARRGMWSPTACGPAPPPVVIAAFEFDPPGPDDENADAEWVELANEGAEPVDMAGWIVRDESTQHRFVFPSGVVLEPGDRVRVRSGCRPGGALDLAWCANDPVWSNGGDTIIVQNPAGNVADRVRY